MTAQGPQTIPVHPRVCGEHLVVSLSRASTFGSSPRVRGTLAKGNMTDEERRFIPACAGNIWVSHGH